MKNLFIILLMLITLLLSVAGAAATTLHGTAVDLDTGKPISYMSVYAGTNDKTDAVGKFDVTIPQGGAVIGFVSDTFEYDAEFAILPMSGSPEYYPETDEIWFIFHVRHKDSTTLVDYLPHPDPAHLGPESSNGNTTPGHTTPAGNAVESTASRWGGALAAALLTLAGLGVAIFTGLVAAPALLTIAAIVGVAAIVGFLIVPLLAKIPIVGQLFGGLQDGGS